MDFGRENETNREILNRLPANLTTNHLLWTENMIPEVKQKQTVNDEQKESQKKC